MCNGGQMSGVKICVKRFLLIGFLGLFMQSPLDAFSWAWPAQKLSGLKSYVSRIIAPLGVSAQKISQCIVKNKRNIGKLAVAGAAAAVCYVFWRMAHPFDPSTTTDSHAFCRWARKQLNRLEADNDFLQRAEKTGSVVHKINDGLAKLDLMRPLLSDLRVRALDQRYDALVDMYARTAEGAPLLGGPLGAHAFLGLTPRDSYATARRVVDARMDQYQAQVAQGAPENPDLFRTIRQMGYIVGTPFGWANYNAYVRGREAVEQLPRQSSAVIGALLERVFALQGSYRSMLPAQ